MSTVAATFELGTHPATALLLGGLATAFLRGRFASTVLVLAPLFGLFHLYGMEFHYTSSMFLIARLDC